jgi:ABC-2 type transport system permease protein
VKLPKPAKKPVAFSEAWPKVNPVWGYMAKVFAITDMEMRKLRHDPSSLLVRAVQPALWLLVFGQVFAKMRAIPTGNVNYMDFLAPGILAQSMLFVSIFYGISIISERDHGILHKFLASPVPRTALVSGKALAAGFRALAQMIIIYILALTQHVDLHWEPLALLGVVVFVFLGAALFSTLSLIIACLVKTRERFMGMGQLMTMPLFFASNAIYPISIMPGWLQTVARVNPLSYEVDGLRTLMIADGVSVFHLSTDFAVLGIMVIGLVLIGGFMYPRIAY